MRYRSSTTRLSIPIFCTQYRVEPIQPIREIYMFFKIEFYALLVEANEMKELLNIALNFTV